VSVTPASILRLVGLGLVAAIVQIAAISQISILGTSADITPLVVASVGLLSGSITGAVMGFAVGLFVDMALVQTPGVSSLVFVGVGYWAGRLLELRDPAHGLVPLAVGAAATAVTELGFSLIQFLLGIDAPVSALLLRQIVAGVVLGALLALPVHAIVRRLLASHLPDDPRRRRRRAYSTGGLSPLTQR
jgi:rod shape-determining protein MreD